MRKFIVDAGAVLMLIVTEAWFLKGYFLGQPDFEPGLAFLAALIAVIAVLARDPVQAYLKTPKNHTNHDQQLFQYFLEVLPPNRTTLFFKQHNFGDSIRKSAIAPLYEFVETWSTVDKEFLDEELESKKKLLYCVASDLANEIAARTVPLGEGDHVSVFSDQQRASGQPRSESVLNDAKILNEKSSQFVTQYEEFVRFCRSKLST